MKTATYTGLQNQQIVVEYDEEAPCRICGKPVVEASIGSALSYAYPENSLNAAFGHQAMHRIEGVARSLKIVMENKIESEKNQKEEEFRNVFEEGEERENKEQELEYVVNWNRSYR